ncbi:LppA family lipoprotein [Nocardia sp. NPDC050793]|uniref:LppA family lipoprotein n=1 Tax=Nocardia sp. NPDC050793 TaxID=3155159 RepID=UPI0033C6780C
MTKKTTAILFAVAAIAIAAVLSLALIVGVWVVSDSSVEPTGEKETAEAAEALLARPTLESSVDQVRSVVEQIAAAGSEIDPRLQFRWIRESSSVDCAKPFDGTNGKVAHLRDLYADAVVPEISWSEFLERARKIAATVGATTSEVMADTPAEGDRPASHDVWFTSADGIIIKVASKRATVISGSTGCRLKGSDFSSPIRPKP